MGYLVPPYTSLINVVSPQHITDFRYVLNLDLNKISDIQCFLLRMKVISSEVGALGSNVVIPYNTANAT